MKTETGLDDLANAREYIQTLQDEVSNLNKYIVEAEQRAWLEQSNDERVAAAEALSAALTERHNQILELLLGAK